MKQRTTSRRTRPARSRAILDKVSPRSDTERAIADVTSLGDARAAAGAPAPAGAGSADALAGALRRAGLLPLLVLHLLRDGPSYGNQLMERIGALTGGLLAVNPNTMYPLLRSLESRGLIAGEWEHPERRSRRFYRLTDAGEAERAKLAGDLAPKLEAFAVSLDALRVELGR